MYATSTATANKLDTLLQKVELKMKTPMAGQ